MVSGSRTDTMVLVLAVITVAGGRALHISRNETGVHELCSHYSFVDCCRRLDKLETVSSKMNGHAVVCLPTARMEA